MRPTIRRLLLTAALLPAWLSVHAQPVDSFLSCIAQKTTASDKKDLAKWMFVSMGAHPEISAMAPLTSSVRDEAPRSAGRIVTSLITEACPAEARAAVRAAGPSAIPTAFTLLGQLAMQELMTDKDVAAAISAIGKNIDSAKVQATLEGE